MSYLALKHLHVTCVLVSGLGFLLRAAWMLADSAYLQQRWTRIFPHIIDTILLTSALGMAIWSAQYPFAVDWLTAKFFGLLAYIGFGTMALKRGRTKKIRAAFIPLAMLAYAYIVMAALSRSPYPW